MSYKTRVEDLIGTVGDDDLITQALQDTGNDIINAMPDSKLLNYAKTTAITSSGLDVSSKKLLAVDKSDIRAYQIPAFEKAKYKDSNSIYLGSDSNPVYYIEDEKVFVIGLGSSNETSGTAHYIPLILLNESGADLTNAHSSVSNFPANAEYLLVIGSAVKCLQRLLADKTASLPSDVSDTLTIPAAPSPPSISPNSVSFSTSAPEYTPPTLGGATEELTGTITNDSDADANKLDFSDWFDIVGDYIQTDEDIELAGSQLQKISTYLNAYAQAMQNKLNIFNDSNVEYQAELQKAIQNAQLSSQDDAQAISKYNGEIQNYSAQVNKAVSEFSAKVQNYGSKIQKQVTDYQWKQGQLQQLQNQYNEGIKKLIT